MEEKRQEKGNAREGIRPYLHVGLAAFLVIAAGVAFFFLLFRMDSVLRFLSQLVSILQPIIYGFVIAYLLNPIMMFAEIRLLPILSRHMGKERRAKALARSLSIVFALLLGGLCLYVLGSIILPNLLESLRGLLLSLQDGPQKIQAWAEGAFPKDSPYVQYIEQEMLNIAEYAENWIKTSLLPQLRTWIGAFAVGVIGVVNVLKNLFIGLIVSIYVLNGKERFCAQAKMLAYAFFRTETANDIIDVVRHGNEIFSGFINGKIIDSTIIGVLCFVGCSLLHIPYALLVSVIVGVTNVIPFFGPYMGAIPSALLILFVSPVKCLYFVIFIILLQQLDGNIIGPAILGDSTGLSAFWVIFSILVAGGLFGIPGMLIGVPTFAVIYYVIQRVTSGLLEKKRMPTDSADYAQIERIVYVGDEVRCTRLSSLVDERIQRRGEKRERLRERMRGGKDADGGQKTSGPKDQQEMQGRENANGAQAAQDRRNAQGEKEAQGEADKAGSDEGDEP